MENSVEEFQRIIDEKGKRASALAGKVLLDGIESEVLQRPLQYFVKRRSDLVRPTLISLSCEAVGGNAEDALDAEVAIILECYHIGLVDDVVDETKIKHLTWTLPGRFGLYVSLMVSIILMSKAYLALGRLSGRLDKERFEEVNQVFKGFLIRMVEGEALNFQLKQEKSIDAEKLIQVFEMQSADIEACTKIGAIIGNGTNEEAEALGRYGRTLGIIFLLREDLMDALNFSVQLGSKLKEGAFPFPVLWAINHSKEFQNFILTVRQKKKITSLDIKKCVQLLFECGAVEHTTNLMEKLAEDATNSLEKLKKKNTKKVFEMFARVQSQMVFKALSE